VVLWRLPRKIYSVKSVSYRRSFHLPAVVEEQAKFLVNVSVTDAEEQVKQLKP